MISGLRRAYYGWLKRPDSRQHFISAADSGVVSFAGPWDRWKDPESREPVISCTIIVTDADEPTRPIYDRMPVVLQKADIGRSLNGEEVRKPLRPAAQDRLRMSLWINQTGTADDLTFLHDVAA